MDMRAESPHVCMSLAMCQPPHYVREIRAEAGWFVGCQTGTLCEFSERPCGGLRLSSTWHAFVDNDSLVLIMMIEILVMVISINVITVK